MIGFIKKDIMMIKGSIKTSILFLLVFLAIAVREENGLIFVPAFLSTMIFMSTFSYDEFNNWNAYATAFPNGRKNLVQAKYIANFSMLVLVVTIFSFLSVVIGTINHNLNLEETVNLALGCIFSLSLFQAILYPFIFKFGIEKGRIGIFIAVFGLTGLISLLKDKINISISGKLLNIIGGNWILFSIIAIIILFIISYFVSMRTVSKKEF